MSGNAHSLYLLIFNLWHHSVGVLLTKFLTYVIKFQIRALVHLHNYV